MRRRSPKRRHEMAEVEDQKDGFRSEMTECAVPWCRRLGQDVHEIARGAHRGEACKVRIAWLYLCRMHHDDMGNYSYWPLPRQYALKAIVDREFYDRVALNRLRGHADDAIDEGEVLQEVVSLLTASKHI